MDHHSMPATTPAQSDALAAIITANPGRVLSRIEAVSGYEGAIYVEYDGSAFLVDADGRVINSH